MSDTGIRVLIVDDHMMVREGIKSVLQQIEDIEVVGEARNGIEAVEQAQRLDPDVVLMDLVMPEMDGVEAARRLKQCAPRSRVLALTSFSSDDLVFPALRAGAVGYLLKDADSQDLIRSIRQAHLGKAALHPAIARKVLDGFRETQEPRTKTESLTEREHDVLELVTEGLTNQQIATRLSVSDATVRTHVSNILSKLHLTNRVQAALHAIRHGLVDAQQDS